MRRKIVPESFYSVSITILIYYILFESLITKYLFNNMSILKYIPEGIIYILLFVFMTTSVRDFKLLKHDKFLVLLLVYSLINTVIINRFDFLLFFLSIRTIYRYIILYFIIVNVNFSTIDIKRFITHIKIVGIIAVVIGLLQLLLPELANPILKPGVYQVGDLIRDDYIVMDSKAIFSVFERYDRFGTFLTLIIPLLIYIPNSKKINDIVVSILSLICLVYSYSRQSWIAFFTSSYLSVMLKRKGLILLFFNLIMIIVVTLIASSGIEVQDVYYGSPMQRVTQLFSSSFMETNLKAARLRIFVEVLPTFLSKLNRYTFIGLGVGNFAALANSLTSGELFMRYFIIFDVQYTGVYHIGDVYWIELIMELGILGFSIFSVFIIKSFIYFFKNCRASKNSLTSSLNLISINAWIACIVTNFFGPSLLLSSFSFFFWLILALATKVNMIDNTDDSN